MLLTRIVGVPLLFAAACCAPRDATRDAPRAAPQNAASLAGFLQLPAERDLEFVAHEGPDATRLVCRREGGDVRTLDGVYGARFDFVFGTPEGYEHPTSKSIWALAPESPRLFYLDAWLWRLECDPPLRFLPSEAVVGASWSWEGSVRLERRELGPATLTLAGIDELAGASGPLRALRLEQHHAASDVRVRWWFAEGLGLIEVEVEEPGAPRRALTWSGLRR